jgi:hypothetical protein
MPKFNRQFVGYEYPNDSLLQQNVLYKYNDLGHRCKNVEDIDMDNYILFAGCSHTLGEGLNLEQTYPYLTAKNLNCDYYNLGMSASGLDVMFYNVMMWLATYKKPKLLVLQYPDHTRFSAITYPPMVLPYGVWTTDNDAMDILTKSEEKGVFAFRNLCFTQLIDTIDIPKIKLVFGSTKAYDYCTKIERLDYAVDNLHYGVETHISCADLISDKYKNEIITSTGTIQTPR